MMRRTTLRCFTPKLTLTATPEFPCYAKNTISGDGDDGGSGSIYVLAHVTAPELPKDATRSKKPLNLTIALDTSTSMDGDRLNKAKEAVSFVIDQCSPRDSVGLVTFATKAERVFPLTKMGGAGKKSALSALKKVYADGWTNLSDGVFTAISDHNSTAATTEGAIRSTLAFTDGETNQGIRGQEELRNALKPRLERADVVLHTFGFGSDHNANLLRALAETGHGSYSFIDGPSSMKESFADCLGGLMSTVAQNIQLSVTPLAGFEVEQVLTSYVTKTGTQEGEGQAKQVIELRDLYSSESRDVLIKLRPSAVDGKQGVKDPKKAASTPLVQVSLEYDSLLSNTKEYISGLDCAVRMVADTKDITVPSDLEADPRVREQKIRVGVAAAMRQATELANNRNLKAARTCLVATAAQHFPCQTLTAAESEGLSSKAKKAQAAEAAKFTDFEAELFDSLSLCFSGLKDAEVYSSSGRFCLNSTFSTQEMQRSSGARGGGFAAWDNSGHRAVGRGRGGSRGGGGGGFGGARGGGSSYDTPAKREMRRKAGGCGKV